jgi:hypothetical protein
LATVCVIVITTDSLSAQGRGGGAAPVTLPSDAYAPPPAASLTIPRNDADLRLEAARLGAAQGAPSTASAPSLDEQEQFLLKAKVIRARGINIIGVTGTTRLTLTDGRLTHDGQFQPIDEAKLRFESTRGTEFNFRDCWCYNVAAYRLARLLDLDMIPPSVERTYNGKKGSFTWWVDDVVMDEAARVKKKIATPDAARWNQQMWHVRLFDQLIYNVDRNLGNLVIDSDWRIWMIDHTRAFRLFDTLKTVGNLVRVDRQFLERLKALDRAPLVEETKNYLTPFEINALLKRRDLIVQHFERVEGSVFDWDRPKRR